MKRSEKVCLFSSLPQECLCEILSKTTPRDVCKLSATCSSFNKAAHSDLVWNNFLPSDIITQLQLQLQLQETTTSNNHFPFLAISPRRLFFSLSSSPVTLDNSLSLSLDKETGRKCYMIPSTMLFNEVGKTPKEWKWAPSYIPGTNLVLKFSRGSRIGSIQGKMQASLLSPRTRYSAYLIFELLVRSVDYYPVAVFVNYVKRGKNELQLDENRAYLTAEAPLIVPVPKFWNFSQLRQDGWMEVMMGEFYHDGVDDDNVDDEVELILKSFKALVSTLHVQGIELRPTESDSIV